VCVFRVRGVRGHLRQSRELPMSSTFRASSSRAQVSLPVEPGWTSWSTRPRESSIRKHGCQGAASAEKSGPFIPAQPNAPLSRKIAVRSAMGASDASEQIRIRQQARPASLTEREVKYSRQEYTTIRVGKARVSHGARAFSGSICPSNTQRLGQSCPSKYTFVEQATGSNTMTACACAHDRSARIE